MMRRPKAMDVIRKMLDKKTTRAFMEYHQKAERASRHVCAECQFETGELDAHESHAPGCGNARAGVRGRAAVRRPGRPEEG